MQVLHTQTSEDTAFILLIYRTDFSIRYFDVSVVTLAAPSSNEGFGPCSIVLTMLRMLLIRVLGLLNYK